MREVWLEEGANGAGEEGGGGGVSNDDQVCGLDSNEMLSIVRYLRCLWLPPLLQFRWWRWWEGSVMMIRSVVWTSNEMLSIVRHLRRLWLPPLLFNSR